MVTDIFMSDKKPKKRRNKTAGAAIDEDLYNSVRDKAKGEGRSLGAIIRSFLIGWSDGEYPTPEVRPGEGRRFRDRKE